MKTVFVLVDALKSSYLTHDNMPFLYELSQKSYYIQNIIPCAGFCERSEIFSGLDGYDTGNFTAIGYIPENSPYSKDSLVPFLSGIIESISERLSRRIFSKWRLKKKRRMNAYRIPYSSLKNFALTEDGDNKLIQHETIFDSLDKSGKTYTLDAFTALSDLSSRLGKKDIETFAKESIDKGIDFIPLYIGIIDSVGHKYGKDIISIKPYLKDVDKRLLSLYLLSQKAGYSFSVLGDHGMVPIHSKIDVQSIVKATNCKQGCDYEAFYDSTIARFWFFNDRSKEKIIQALHDGLNKYGFIVNAENALDYRIPLDIKGKTGKPVYGDLAWCANPGVLISPDYFHSQSASENGMHGYLGLVEGDGTGLFVLSSKIIHEEEISNAHSSEVCSLLCKTLEINTPNSIGWKRIV